MPILNITGYQFIALHDLATLQQYFLNESRALQLKGTILLSAEGINITVAGTVTHIHSFKQILQTDERFAAIIFKESYSDAQPFKHFKVKLKAEIITLRQPAANPLTTRAPSITPEILQQWLDEKRDITLLDTRNHYEVNVGTFRNAVSLNLKNFCEFPQASTQISRDKPIVMFCTGGIRCEKAALYLLTQGFPTVYQLDGGILNYFARVGGVHYDGECYVFDERGSVVANYSPPN